MKYKIFTLQNNQRDGQTTHHAIPCNEDGVSLGYEFETEQEAEDALNNASYFKINTINPNGQFQKGGREFIIMKVY